MKDPLDPPKGGGKGGGGGTMGVECIVYLTYIYRVSIVYLSCMYRNYKRIKSNKKAQMKRFFVVMCGCGVVKWGIWGCYVREL